MAHSFTLMSLVDHDCFSKLTHDLDLRLHRVGRSKLPRSLIPTENQLVENSVIERLTKVNSGVISYDLCMSRKTEEIFLFTAHYFTGTERKNTHIVMPPTPATDGVYLSLSVM